MSTKFCVYCEGVFSADVVVCPTCNELDGLLPSVSGNPAEDEEYSYWTDEDKEEFADEDNEPDGSWMDADALASVGWGTDEDYGFDGWMEE